MKNIALLCLLMFSTASVSGQVTPFLTTTWNQTCYYNALTPTVASGGSCGRAYTGCNATALAQICKYYNYPTAGIGGSHCNSTSTTNCVNFSAQTYSYSLMPNNVTSANSEVAKLMYNLGVACDMTWSGTNSTSFFDASVLKKYFAYSPKMYSTASFMFNTTADLIAAIKTELNAGRPVFAKGGGHFYLIDGYDASNNFHMNFGWSGTYNAYYSITSVVNGAGNFTPSNFMFHIKPLTGTLETSLDTINVSSAANLNQVLEFTSTSNFTLTTANTWIMPNITSGSPGYYYFANGSTFNTSINNGAIRYGKIILQNASTTKTVVVKQDASPLIVNPTPLNYLAAGSTETVSVNYVSMGTWTVTTPTSWLNLSNTSGTGNGSFSVTANSNTASIIRTGLIIVKGGIYTDSIPVTQAGNITTFVQNFNEANLVHFTMFPNPSNTVLNIIVSENLIQSNYIITDELGRLQTSNKISSTQIKIDTGELNEGVYYLQINGQSKKLLVIHH